MNKNTILALAIAAGVLPAGVQAADTNFSYTFVEAGVTDRDFDGYSADGLIGRGSLEINDLFFVHGDMTLLSTSGTDINTLAGGVGAAMSFSNMIDGFAKASLVRYEIGSLDDTGLGLEVGARARVIDQVEAFGSVKYVNIDSDSDVGIEVGGRYWLTNNWGFSASYTDADFMGSGVTLAARFSF